MGKQQRGIKAVQLLQCVQFFFPSRQKYKAKNKASEEACQTERDRKKMTETGEIESAVIDKKIDRSSG